ncbi:MAG: hypothetical protein OHK0022_37530 [Roseiflexaceae bacterium]
MRKGLIRLLAFFSKEINEVRRQPRLVLSLLLGPFLILMLFGIGYQSDRPHLRTVLVVPPEWLDDPRLEQIKQGIALNFDLVRVDSDYEAAMADLKVGRVEVVEVLPPDLEQRLMDGQQSPVIFKYNEINPLNEQWVQYLAYAQVNELNRTVLLDTTRQLQAQAAQTNSEIGQARDRLDALERDMDQVDRAELRRSLGGLRDTAALLAINPLLAAQIRSEGGDPAQTQAQLAQLRQDLDTLDQSLGDGTIEQRRAELRRTRERLGVLEDATGRISRLPPEVIVSPLQQQYENIRGQPYSLMIYYAPSVVALILQHIAVTLGALSLVRERLLGATEFYGVAPVSMVQVLVGKYLGYTLFIGLMAAVLVTLMIIPPFTLPGIGTVTLLAIPFQGSPLVFAGVVALYTLASLGIGFVISAVSSSDSQAVQLSMLVLLLSIFFSGFFLPLENFAAVVRPIGYALPLTHGIAAFQALMLRGIQPDTLTWTALGLIAGIAFLLVAVLWRRQFRGLA